MERRLEIADQMRDQAVRGRMDERSIKRMGKAASEELTN